MAFRRGDLVRVKLHSNSQFHALVVEIDEHDEPAQVLVGKTEGSLYECLPKFISESQGCPSSATASNSQRVLEHFERHPTTSVALLPIDLPELGGLRTLRKLRSMSARPAVIIIGPKDREIARHVLDCGAFDYITPPLDPSTLLGSVLAAIAHVELRRHSSVLGRILRRFLRSDTKVTVEPLTRQEAHAVGRSLSTASTQLNKQVESSDSAAAGALAGRVQAAAAGSRITKKGISQKGRDAVADPNF